MIATLFAFMNLDQVNMNWGLRQLMQVRQGVTLLFPLHHT